MTGGRSAPTALGGRSRWTDVDGPVHFLDFGGPARGPVIVGVHGLSGSAVNWAAIAPLLTGRYRFIAPDLAGHGLTRTAGRDPGVFANRVLLHRFIESCARRPVILMGNSMGGMISLLEAAASPETVSALILVDPALPFAFARPDPVVATMFALYGTPGLGGLLRSLRRDAPPEAQVARLLSLCCADPSRVSAQAVAQHVEMERRREEFPDRSQAFNQAMRSVAQTISRGRGQAYRAIVNSVACPVLLVQGDRDRLMPVSVARSAARAHPDWTLAVLPGVGHVPQLEVPRDTAGLILDWLASSGRPASTSSAAASTGVRAALSTAGRAATRAARRALSPPA
jgi:pimeloyl-ACP methyl ester carboxylesterase